jgi:phosphoribosylanthranilate isomerase
MPVKIKICGITNLEDALAAADLGADVLGFNFYEKSPRYISPDDACEIMAVLPYDTMTAGVFVNADPKIIQSLDSVLDFVQLHGDETADYVAGINGGSNVIKAMRIGPDFDVTEASTYTADAFLLDSNTRDFGGSGERFDWNIAIRFKEVAPRFYLAGGLTPDNVAEAIRKVQPYAVDVCSGVESTKGKKDHKKLEAFIRNARAAAL